MQIVNRYVCQTGCDVAAARAGHDPKNPRNDPVKARQLEEQRALASGRPVEEKGSPGTIAASGSDALSADAVDAVTFGGQLAGLSVPRGSGSSAVSRLVDRVA